jgi:hypothetical protein
MIGESVVIHKSWVVECGNQSGKLLTKGFHRIPTQCQGSETRATSITFVEPCDEFKIYLTNSIAQWKCFEFSKCLQKLK